MFTSTKETDEFSGYVVRNDIVGVQHMVAAGFDIDSEIRDARSALHLAVACAKIEMCRAVLDLGADVNLQFSGDPSGSPAGFSALHHAASAQNQAKVELLLAAGANPNVRSWFGVTPIHELLQESAKGPDASCWLGCLSALLKAGADPDAIASKPLRLKMRSEFDKLFGAGAGEKGGALTTMHFAVLISHVIDANIAVAARLQGCHGARVLELLLAHGAEPNFMPANPAKNYLTPLQMAVKFGSGEDVLAMLESGRADVVQKTVAGRSLRQLTSRPEIQAILRSDLSAVAVERAIGQDVARRPISSQQGAAKVSCGPL
jgi:ankyrin repeat protein